MAFASKNGVNAGVEKFLKDTDQDIRRATREEDSLFERLVQEEMERQSRAGFGQFGTVSVDDNAYQQGNTRDYPPRSTLSARESTTKEPRYFPSAEEAFRAAQLEIDTGFDKRPPSSFASSATLSSVGSNAKASSTHTQATEPPRGSRHSYTQPYAETKHYDSAHEFKPSDNNLRAGQVPVSIPSSSLQGWTANAMSPTTGSGSPISGRIGFGRGLHTLQLGASEAELERMRRAEMDKKLSYQRDLDRQLAEKRERERQLASENGRPPSNRRQSAPSGLQVGPSVTSSSTLKIPNLEQSSTSSSSTSSLMSMPSSASHRDEIWPGQGNGVGRRSIGAPEFALPSASLAPASFKVPSSVLPLRESMDEKQARILQRKKQEAYAQALQEQVRERELYLQRQKQEEEEYERRYGGGASPPGIGAPESFGGIRSKQSSRNAWQGDGSPSPSSRSGTPPIYSGDLGAGDSSPANPYGGGFSSEDGHENSYQTNSNNNNMTHTRARFRFDRLDPSEQDEILRRQQQQQLQQLSLRQQIADKEARAEEEKRRIREEEAAEERRIARELEELRLAAERDRVLMKGRAKGNAQSSENVPSPLTSSGHEVLSNNLLNAHKGDEYLPHPQPSSYASHQMRSRPTEPAVTSPSFEVDEDLQRKRLEMQEMRRQQEELQRELERQRMELAKLRQMKEARKQMELSSGSQYSQRSQSAISSAHPGRELRKVSAYDAAEEAYHRPPSSGSIYENNRGFHKARPQSARSQTQVPDPAFQSRPKVGNSIEFMPSSPLRTSGRFHRDELIMSPASEAGFPRPNGTSSILESSMPSRSKLVNIPNLQTQVGKGNRGGRGAQQDLSRLDETWHPSQSGARGANGVASGLASVREGEYYTQPKHSSSLGRFDEESVTDGQHYDDDEEEDLDKTLQVISRCFVYVSPKGKDGNNEANVFLFNDQGEEVAQKNEVPRDTISQSKSGSSGGNSKALRHPLGQASQRQNAKQNGGLLLRRRLHRDDSPLPITGTPVRDPYALHSRGSPASWQARSFATGDDDDDDEDDDDDDADDEDEVNFADRDEDNHLGRNQSSPLPYDDEDDDDEDEDEEAIHLDDLEQSRVRTAQAARMALQRASAHSEDEESAPDGTPKSTKSRRQISGVGRQKDTRSSIKSPLDSKQLSQVNNQNLRQVETPLRDRQQTKNRNVQALSSMSVRSCSASPSSSSSSSTESSNPSPKSSTKNSAFSASYIGQDENKPKMSNMGRFPVRTAAQDKTSTDDFSFEPRKATRKLAARSAKAWERPSFMVYRNEQQHLSASGSNVSPGSAATGGALKALESASRKSRDTAHYQQDGSKKLANGNECSDEFSDDDDDDDDDEYVAYASSSEEVPLSAFEETRELA